MITKYLNEQWKMQPLGSDEVYETCIPTSVYNDLINNGKLDDPYYRDNELTALKLAENDYSYSTVFTAGDFLGCDRVLLVFEGIDTLADIYLNDELLAGVNNMHRTWQFDVRGLLKEENSLRVVLHSPTKFIREEYEKDPILSTEDAMMGMPYLRKAHCMFGWDWGPRLPDEGIWRPVKLLGIGSARFDGINIRQKHDNGRVFLNFDIDVDITGDEKIRRLTAENRGGKNRVTDGPGKPDFAADDAEPAEYGQVNAAGASAPCRIIRESLSRLSCRGKITAPDGSIRELSHEELINGIEIENPELWWPNGFGKQPLYTVEVGLLEKNTGNAPAAGPADDIDETASFCLLDTFSKRIGLRTMTMHREWDEYGQSFCHEVNGVSIFAMGADYIPEDNILARTNRERTYNLLLQAKNANHNCVRVWGGGYYPEDWFYDACDELGLMVWQDFMFACAVYSLTDEFEENIRAEFADNIKRIRNHPSLGLWCGNNEMEMFVMYGTWVNKPVQKSDYIKMYEYIIPKMLKEYDPDTFYWPASPSSGGAFDDPNCENRGDVHYWDVWHGNKPITEYRKFFFRYVSEFGFQSFPGLKTCEAFTEPEDRNIFSYVMEKHQRNAAANGKIMNYMEQTFLYPTSFDITLYASQLLQAEAMRYGVEHFRRNRGRCMGAVVWQLNDCWPVASWSSIDYYGRWKALHYYEKRFFAPLMISCAEEGILTQNTNPNAEPYDVIKSITLNVANETLSDEKLTVKWALRDASASIIRSGENDITVPALTSVWLEREDMKDASLYENYISYECLKNEEVISSGTVLFTAPKQFRFRNPELTVLADGDELVIHASAYARSVEILNEDDTMLLSDNYFDMNAGERRVKILKGKPDGLKIRSVYDIR